MNAMIKGQAMKRALFAAVAALALAISAGGAEAWYRGGFAHAGGWGHYGGTFYHGGTAGGFYHGTVVHDGNVWHTGGYGPYYHSPVVVNHYGCWNCGASGWGYAGAAAAGALAGAAVGAAATSAAMAASGWPVGATYGYLPTGCAYQFVAGLAYYRCAAGWLRPAYGANGVYYTVVPAP